MFSLQQASGTAKDQPPPVPPLSESELILLRWYRLLGEEDQANVRRFVSALGMTRSQRKN
ncbi:hypothetical protein D3C76_1817630 [compost metagenome]